MCPDSTLSACIFSTHDFGNADGYRPGCSAGCEGHRLANQVLRFEVLSKTEDIAGVVFHVEVSAIVGRVLDRASNLDAT
jgi:hypothetical protein